MARARACRAAEAAAGRDAGHGPDQPRGLEEAAEMARSGQVRNSSFLARTGDAGDLPTLLHCITADRPQPRQLARGRRDPMGAAMTSFGKGVAKFVSARQNGALPCMAQAPSILVVVDDDPGMRT